VTISNEMSGGEALARMLQAHHVGPLFGMGGFQLLPFYDAVRRLGLRHALISDERCGAFAADAYARVTNRVGVCDATLGPGATNLVTALVESLNAGVPVVAIVGDSHRAHAWRNMTQESRQLEILRPAVKEVLRVERIERVPELVRRAFAIATTGRPGPVVLDVPEDIAHATHGFEDGELVADPRSEKIPALRCRPDWEAVQAAAELLAQATRPIILAGGGVHLSDAAEALQGFAEDYAIPVAHTLSGKGAIACTHPLSAGIFGRYSRIANDLIAAADCILVVGCKLGEIATRRYTVPPPGKALVHLDIVAEEIGRCYPPAIALWGDVRAGIEDLIAAMPDAGMTARKARRSYTTEVRENMAAWRRSVAERLGSDEMPVSMARLMGELNRALPADGILVADGGFAAHWGGLLFDSKRPGRGFVPDRGLASIGYGVPGAIGAKLGAPGRPVVALTGDGGLNMALGELETARRLGLGITVVVVNNAASGYVKALQHLMYGAGAYQSSDLCETDYAAIARAMGCHGLRVERPADLAGALQNALGETAVPVIVDVVVTRDPAQMLPAADSRAAAAKPGDRVA
jgi:acetolactate synthase I/II/III large subunit